MPNFIRPAVIAALALFLNAALTSGSGIPAADSSAKATSISSVPVVDTGAGAKANPIPAVSDSTAKISSGLPIGPAAGLLLDTTVKPRLQKSLPVPAAGAAAAAVIDTFHASSGAIIGVGIGVSLGDMSAFNLWQSGLPQLLSDLQLNDSSFAVPGDTFRLAFTVEQSPDIYNMMFPISVFYSRLYPNHRLTASLSFAALSKEYDARLSLVDPVDSLRHIDIRQTLGIYSLTARVNWGVRIPERFFSVDNIDRTDAIIGLSASPWVLLGRSSSLSISSPLVADPRLTELYNYILPQISSFSATGMAFGWHAGIATIRHSSGHSGLEAEITYSGLLYTNFRTGSGALTQGTLAENSSEPGKILSTYTSRIDITISLIRKIF